MKEKIKEYWEMFATLTRSNGFIFIYPCAALTLLALIPPRPLPFFLLIIWVVAVMNNSDDER